MTASKSARSLLERFGKLLDQTLVLGEEIHEPLLVTGQTALICPHLQHFPRPVGVPLCQERQVYIRDRSEFHSFAWPLPEHFQWLLICNDCLQEAKGDAGVVNIMVGGTIQLLTTET